MGELPPAPKTVVDVFVIPTFAGGFLDVLFGLWRESFNEVPVEEQGGYGIVD